MSRPATFPKPDLSRFKSRVIPVSTDRSKLESKLQEWMTQVVHSTHQPSTLRNMPAAKALVTLSTGIDSILDAPPTMKLGPASSEQTIHATFDLAGLPSGAWYVVHVTFSVQLSQFSKQMRDRQSAEEIAAENARIRARAEAENKLHPKAAAFKTALHVDTWTADIKKGAALLQGDFDAVYEYAKKAASIPGNPISVKDVAMGGVGLGVGKLGTASSQATKLAEQYDKIDTAISRGEKAMKYGEMIKGSGPEDVFTKSQNKIYKTGAGDIVADEVIDAASNLPGAGPFIKGFAAMFFNFAAANYAGAVVKVRGRAYSWFIAGYIQGLTGVALESPPANELDSYFFKFGLGRTFRDSEADKFCVQVFLLWYSSSHYIIGSTSPGEKMSKPLDWTFPDGYLAFWSPERLAYSMATLLKKKQYLID